MSMDQPLRAVQPDEMGAFLRACEAAFHEDAPDDVIDRYSRLMPAERTLAALDGDAIVGTAAAYPFSLSVPGGDVRAAGVSMIGVLPSHRRRGILRAMIRRQFDDIRAWGEPVAVLWASEGSIYQRFGYGPGSQFVETAIERDRIRFLDDPGLAGHVRLVEADEAVPLLQSVYENVRRAVPGLYARTDDWWRLQTLRDTARDRRGAGPMFRAVWERDGRAEAYALYRVKQRWDVTPRGTLRVTEALAATPEAERELWGFLLGVDLIATIEAGIAADSPLPLLVEEPNRLGLRRTDGLWTRIVDLPAALTARSYEVDAVVTLTVDDSSCPWNDGTWRIETDSGKALVDRTDGEADLRLGARDLAALYLGGTSASDLVRAGRIAEVTPGAARRTDELFRSERAPFCPEIF